MNFGAQTKQTWKQSSVFKFSHSDKKRDQCESLQYQVKNSVVAYFTHLSATTRDTAQSFEEKKKLT